MNKLQWRKPRKLAVGRVSQQTTNGLFTVIGFRDGDGGIKYRLLNNQNTALGLFGEAQLARDKADQAHGV